MVRPPGTNGKTKTEMERPITPWALKEQVLRPKPSLCWWWWWWWWWHDFSVNNTVTTVIKEGERLLASKISCYAVPLNSSLIHSYSKTLLYLYYSGCSFVLFILASFLSFFLLHPSSYALFCTFISPRVSAPLNILQKLCTVRPLTSSSLCL
jgi:hypothetical protein